MNRIDPKLIAFRVGSSALLLYVGLMAGALVSLRLNFPLPVWSFTGLVIFGLASWLFFRKESCTSVESVGYAILPPLLALSCLWIGTWSQELFFDAIWYHHDGVYQFVSGWNPYSGSVEESKTAYCADYINHFPKGHWAIGALAYQLFTSIEAGKGFNLFLILGVFLSAPFLLKKGFNLNDFWAWVGALILALNPVATQNLFSFYADGPVASLSSLALLHLFAYFKDRSASFLFLILAACFGLLNLKFSAALIGLLIGLLAFVASFKGIENEQIKKRALGILLFAGLALILADWHPYITNWQQKGHPLYPVSKPDFFKEDNYPGNFVGKNRVFKFAFSLWAESGWIRHPANAQLKSIFEFSGLGVYGDGLPDLSGMGPLFAEAFTLSQLLFIFWLFLGGIDRRQKLNQALGFGVLWIFVLLIPEAWIFRYVPWLWLLAFYPIALVLNVKGWKWPAYLLVLLLAFNTYRILPVIFNSQYAKASELKRQIEMLKGHEDSYSIDAGWSYTFKNRLGAMGIDTSKLIWIAPEDTPYVELKGSLGGKFKVKHQ